MMSQVVQRNSPMIAGAGRGRLVWVMSLVLGFAGANGATAASPAKVDFTREVRPILSGHCFKCHGPDEGTRQGGLRLDVRAEAMKPAKSGEAAIVSGKPDKSEVVARLFTENEDDLMPPPEAKHPLSAAQKEILKRWIAEGAEYQAHWAFQAPKQTRLPKTRDKSWP